MTIFIIFIIVAALVFCYINGFHDSANSISTIVSTRVLSPLHAVLWAAFFNFVAAFGLGTFVAKTVGSGLIDLSFVTPSVILSGLLGAIIWDIITWWLALPTSSSHALIGGYAGAALARVGWKALIVGGWLKTALFIFLAPLIGFAVAWILMFAIIRLFAKQPPALMDKHLRKLQLFSAAIYSLGHGTSDAQKTMGIIAGLLFITPQYAALVTAANGTMMFPFWLLLLCHFTIALGTLFGGWRIVRTLGGRITNLKPVGGFCAETAGAITLFGAALLGVPVSTTQTITGAIVGVGMTRRSSSVRWVVAGRILWAWILTIPASALIAAVIFLLISAAGY
ncbi:MAG: inorganic phosphate transporter [Candidatus Peribacteraceae bacterium]|nr:inorganic phosphate transporter [Candidatus Peribacteraceae bacterium]